MGGIEPKYGRFARRASLPPSQWRPCKPEENLPLLVFFSLKDSFFALSGLPNPVGFKSCKKMITIILNMEIIDDKLTINVKNRAIS